MAWKTRPQITPQVVFSFFKRTVRGFNCKKDFNGGQGQLCGFADVYLKQTVFDENLYDIAEAFDKKRNNNFFSWSSSSEHFPFKRVRRTAT